MALLNSLSCIIFTALFVGGAIILPFLIRREVEKTCSLSRDNSIPLEEAILFLLSVYPRSCQSQLSVWLGHPISVVHETLKKIENEKKVHECKDLPREIPEELLGWEIIR